MPLHPELFSILACPKCKGPVTEHKEKKALVCDACCLQYEISGGIPVMLIEEATPFK